MLSYRDRGDLIMAGGCLTPAPGFSLINIDAFIKKFSKGAIISEDLRRSLLRCKLYEEHAVYLDDNIIAEYEERLNTHLRSEQNLFKCAELNNKGIEAEKDGRVADAIAAYEKNISVAHVYPAHHSFERLAILYRKAKDVENERRVLLRALEVFSPSASDWYRDRLQKLNTK